jgi:hypothetical protein
MPVALITAAASDYVRNLINSLAAAFSLAPVPMAVADTVVS